MTRRVEGVENNVYEIDCGENIIQDDFTTTLLTFDSSQITPPCTISGTIFYEDPTRKSLQTEVKNFPLIEQLVTTTTPVIGGGMDRSKLILIVVLTIIIAIMIVPVVIRVYRKFKDKKLETYLETIEKEGITTEKKEEEKNTEKEVSK